MIRIDFSDYMDVIYEKSVSQDKIAIIYATGPINSGKGSYNSIGSETTVKAIRQATKDEKVKAIVLRVNSPGGSALASDVILRELNLAKQKNPHVSFQNPKRKPERGQKCMIFQMFYCKHHLIE